MGASYIGAARLSSCTLNSDAETVLIEHGVNIDTSNLGSIKIVLTNIVLPPSTKPTPSFDIKSFKGELAASHDLYDHSTSGFTYTA